MTFSIYMTWKTLKVHNNVNNKVIFLPLDNDQLVINKTLIPKPLVNDKLLINQSFSCKPLLNDDTC